MKKQKVCALFCIAAISMSLATPAIAEDRYSNLNETEIQQKASAQEETMISETEETPGGKVNQPEQELPENIVTDSNNRNPEQQTTEEKSDSTEIPDEDVDLSRISGMAPNLIPILRMRHLVHCSRVNGEKLAMTGTMQAGTGKCVKVSGFKENIMLTHREKW